MTAFNRIDKKTWLELDSKLTKIENEWREKMLKDKYIDEFVPQSFRILDDINSLTVLENKYWMKLLNTEIGVNFNNFRDSKVFNIKNDRHHYSINIIEWTWSYKNRKYHLFDISFEVTSNISNISEEYGAIFLDNDIVLINMNGKLELTKFTPNMLVDRIPSFTTMRNK